MTPDEQLRAEKDYYPASILAASKQAAEKLKSKAQQPSPVKEDKGMHAYVSPCLVPTLSVYNVDTQTHVHVHMHTRARAHTHTNTHTLAHAQTLADIHTRSLDHSPARTHTHKHPHTRSRSDTR